MRYSDDDLPILIESGDCAPVLTGVLMKRWLMCAALAALGGCATPIAGSSEIVVTGNIDQVRECRLIKQVFADQVFIGGNTGRQDVVQQFRNEAVKAGATHVLTLDVTQDRGFTATGSGELYRCG